MNLNGLVLNLSPSGLCVHLVVELQPAAERKPHHKSPHRQSQPGKEPACAKTNADQLSPHLQRPSKNPSSPNMCRGIIA